MLLAWWYTPVISTTQEDCEFQARLGNGSLETISKTK
jgi:hypothetical protein